MQADIRKAETGQSTAYLNSGAWFATQILGIYI